VSEESSVDRGMDGEPEFRSQTKASIASFKDLKFCLEATFAAGCGDCPSDSFLTGYNDIG